MEKKYCENFTDSSFFSATSKNLESTMLQELPIDRQKMTLKQISQSKSKQSCSPVKQESLRDMKSPVIKKKISKVPQKWSDSETKKFHKLVQLFGTDFQLMQKLHLQRSRKQIKNKFRKEERSNLEQIKVSLSKQNRMKFMKLHSRLADLKSEHQNYIEEKQVIDPTRKGSSDSINLGKFIRKRCDSLRSVDSLDLTLVDDLDALIKKAI